MPNKNIILGIVIVLIVASIVVLERIRSENSVNVPTGSADIPLMLAFNGTSTATGSCSAGVCTSSPSAVFSSTTISSAVSSGYLTPRQKASMYPRAKELVDPSGFINSPAAGSSTDPFKIADLIGKKVILIDFWTYSCINCQRTIPYLNDWYSKYESDGLVIIGVHTPEFDFEKVEANVAAAVKQYGIHYPVVMDNDMGTWNAYGNLYWPHEYLIDIDGFIVHDHIGEGDYDATEKEIQYLLNEKMIRDGVSARAAAPLVAEGPAQRQTSPETYFGYARNEYLSNGVQGVPGPQTLSYSDNTLADAGVAQLYLSGAWNFADQYAENQGPAQVGYNIIAKNVYIVARSAASGTPVDVDVYLDGRFEKTIAIQGAQLYPLIGDGNGAVLQTLTLKIPKAGLRAYTFTFGS